MKYLILSFAMVVTCGASAGIMWKDNARFKRVSEQEIQKNIEAKKKKQKQANAKERARNRRAKNLALRSKKRGPQVYGNLPAQAPKPLSKAMEQVVKSIAESAWGQKNKEADL